jgi:class 3 adenylate cyclase/tetratricopeptide (TPR) repeat protein
MSSGADPSTGRRHRTLLITDIVSSTEHLARLGDARWRELLERHGARVQERVTAASGRVLSDRGDGFLIAFEHAAPAVSCAEQLCLDTAELGVAIRAGLHAGECELLGDQLAGMAIHIAARVSGLAGSGEVLMSDNVRALVDDTGLELADRGVHELRGVPGHWRVWALHSDALRAAALRVEPVAAGPPALPLPPAVTTRLSESTLVGRARELQLGQRAFELVRAGGRRTLLVAGEPGIGKTRLVAELAARLHAAGATVLWGRSDPQLAIPYQPFVELLTHYARFASPDVLAQHRSQFGHELARLVPELGGAASAPSPAPERSAEENRHVMLAAVHGLLRTAALQRPLTLVLDDLHWADPATLLMLRYVLVAPEPVPALVIGAYTAAQLPAHHRLGELVGELRRDRCVERIVVEGLSSEHVLELAREFAREEPDPPTGELVRTLSEQTGGNPFFVRELLRNLSDSGGLAAAARAHAAGEVAPMPVTSGIRETIVGRVARLGEDAERVLTAAAAAGREFDAELLAAMLDVAEDQLADVLDAAVGAALITEVPGIGLRYSFVHSLIHPALYEQLGSARRRLLHRRALEALERLLGPEARGERIGELAGHALNAVPMVEPARAIDYVRRAGEHALEQLAPQDATRWFERGLELHRRAELGREQADQLRCELLIGRGIAQRQCGDAAFRETLLEAGALARRVDDRSSLVRAALANTRGFVSETGKVDAERIEMLEAALAAVGAGDSPERARLLAVLSSELTFAGDWPRRKALSDESAAIASRLGDPAIASDVLSLRFITVWTPETLHERLADTERGLALAEEVGDPLALLRALHWRAATAVETGRLQLAADLVARQSELAERLREPTYSWLAAYDRATQALMAGLLEEAERSAEDARALAERSAQPEALAFYAGQLINVRFEQGRLAELEPLIAVQVQDNPGIPAFRAALTLARAEAGMRSEASEVLAIDAEAGFSELPYDSNWLVGLVIYAEACSLLGESIPARPAAATLHGLLAPWADQVAFNSATTWGLVRRHVGNLERVLGRYEQAEESLRHAAERHAAMAAPLWLARTRLDLARLLLERGTDGDEAAQLLEQAAETARELGCASVERRSVALLARVREPA